MSKKRKKDYKVMIPKRSDDFESEDSKGRAACATAIVDCLFPAYGGCACVVQGLAIVDDDDEEDDEETEKKDA